MLARLRALLRPPAAEFAPPAPEEPLAVIGDVHGCDGLLERLLDRIDAEAPDHRIVVVGDMVDRGDDSRGVLRRLIARREATCLMGNHELMLLDFLDRPETGGRWLRHGGLQTLASYGLGAGLSEHSPPGLLARARDALADRMGTETIDWLRARPGFVQSGTVAVVHAGADPRKPLSAQSQKTLAWGAPGFGQVARADGLWIAHGHVVVDAPTAEAGRIAVDTGAYATGRLTVALIDGAGVRFIAETDR